VDLAVEGGNKIKKNLSLSPAAGWLKKSLTVVGSGIKIRTGRLSIITLTLSLRRFKEKGS